MRGEFSRYSKRYGKPGAFGSLESRVIQTECLIADPIAQTYAEVQRNLLREYEQKFAYLLEQEKLTKLSSNAGFSKNIEKGQFFITFDDDTFDKLMGSCREYILLRRDESSQVKGWICENTKIRPVLDVMVCYHQGRYGVEIVIDSLFRERLLLGEEVLVANVDS